MNKNFYLLIVIVAVAIGGFIILRNKERQVDYLDEFAKCLADKGIVMYGADWCPHCQNEKKAFGKSFSLIPYVECPDDPKRCLAAGISGFPTWTFPDPSTSSGQAIKKLEGEQGLQKLSEESGCPLPVRQSLGDGGPELNN